MTVAPSLAGPVSDGGGCEGKKELAAPRSLGAVRAALALLDVRGSSLVWPILLQWAAGLLRLIAMGLWVPLLHGLLSGDVTLGKRFRLLEGYLPTIDAENRGTFLATLAGGILIATLIKGVLGYFGERATLRRALAGEIALGEKIVRLHLRLGQAYYDVTTTSKTAHHLHRLPTRVARLVRWLVRSAATTLELTLLLFFMVWLSPWLTLGSIGVILFYFFGLRGVVARAEERVGETEDEEDEAAHEIHDLAQNLLLVRLNTKEPDAVREFRDRRVRRTDSIERRQGVRSFLDEAEEGVNLSVLLAFVLGVAWFLQPLDGGAVSRYLVFFFVFRRAMRTFSTLQRLPRQWQNIKGHVTNALRLLHTGDKPLVPGGASNLGPLRKGVSVRGLTFSYDGTKPVVEQASFDAPVGRLTVIVGPNGAGKSTLLELILRLYDCPPGSIFIDEVDIRSLDVGLLRETCAYAGGEPLLLDAPLRENLTIGLGPVSDERLGEAARISGLESLIGNWEQGFDHYVGHGGLTLSGGERQRVGLCRALLRSPRVLLLDEATSCLDPEADARTMSVLGDLAASRVVLAVTHRPTSIPAGANVVVLDQGRVVECGERNELAARAGPFRRLLETEPRSRPRWRFDAVDACSPGERPH